MRTGNFLELGYHSTSVSKTHFCVPVKFFIRSSIPYIVAFDEERGHLIVLGADKIERAAKSRKSLPQATVQELRDYVNSAWGMMIQHREAKRIEVEFEANASVAPYFETTRLHSSQTMAERRGKHVFRLLVHNEKEFGRYLLRFGRAVRILSPESAIGELTGFLSEMEAFYAGKAAVREPE
jgi:predicted DNA-binding transcriptional regulator YafY